MRAVQKTKVICIFLAALLFLFAIAVRAENGIATCHGKVIDPFTDICWSCLFPITLGNTPVSSGDLPDTDNSSSLLCRCGEAPFYHYGVSMGYWEPMGLVDVTRTPYCAVSFGGTQIYSGNTAQGTVETQTTEQNGAFYYVHFYNFPILENFASWIFGGSCQIDGGFLTPTYFSELDPTWHDEKLAALVFPETLLFTNPVTALGAEASCALDSAAANFGLPSDPTFWCAGSQGFMYPMSGKVVEQVSPIQATTLIAERAIFKLHQLLMLPDTDSSNLCMPSLKYHLQKSRYRYQMSYPSQGPCKPFGRTTTLWNSGKMHLINGDDTAYVIWRKRNCCNY
ncbi:conjugal transfer pilus assembly protein TraU [soil metagenome]